MQLYTAICFVTLSLVSKSSTAPEGRIYDGWPIEIKDAPYMAQVYWYHDYDEKISECGGGILSNTLILTGGHCVMNSKTLEKHDIEGFTVYVGTTIKRDHYDGQKFTVSKIYYHPEFKGNKGLFYHDMSILRVDGTIKIGKEHNTELLQLPSPNEEPQQGHELWVQGWGSNPENKGDKRLYRATMKIAPGKKCYRKKKETVEEFEQHEVYAVPVDGKTCPGDSGSPAIDMKTNKVVGLDSFSTGGKGCDNLHPIVFVKVLDNLDFINDAMGNDTAKNSHDDTCDDDDMYLH